MSNIFVENYENLPENEIISKINGGDYELLQVVINRYLPVIMHYVGKYCNPADREDAIQEATLALYSAVKTFDSEKSSFSTFATLCIKRSVIGTLRNSKKNRAIPSELVSSIEEVEVVDSNSAEKIFFEKQEYENLIKSIKLELSSLEYKVLNLFLSGKKYSDIAKALDITEKSVDNSLARIRRKLKCK